jgi:sugar lactone lactonase YvrE
MNLYEGLEVLCSALCIVGESPVWDRERACLWMADVHGRRMRRIDFRSGRVHDTVFPSRSARWCPPGAGG